MLLSMSCTQMPFPSDTHFSKRWQNSATSKQTEALIVGIKSDLEMPDVSALMVLYCGILGLAMH